LSSGIFKTGKRRNSSTVSKARPYDDGRTEEAWRREEGDSKKEHRNFRRDAREIKHKKGIGTPFLGAGKNEWGRSNSD